MIPRPTGSTLFPYTTLFRSEPAVIRALAVRAADAPDALSAADPPGGTARYAPDRLVTECARTGQPVMRSEEHTSELQSQSNLVCRLLLEKKKKQSRK